MKVKIFVLGVFMLVSLTLCAAPDAYNVTVGSIRAMSNEKLLIGFNGGTGNLNPQGSCNVLYHFIEGLTKKAKNMMLSIALTAKSTGKQVDLKIDGSRCENNYPVVTEIILK